MKAKLIKTDKGNYILIDPTKGVYDKGYHLGNSRECDVPKLSKQNCDEIFGVVDVEKLADSIFEKESSNTLHPQYQMRNTFILGFNKAMELYQPTEIEVEIEMICPHPMDTYRCGLQYGCDGDGCNHPNQIPYLDSEGCLILKKI